VLTGWDAFQVFGWRRPPDGVDWDFDVDYLSYRGVGGGTSLLYNRPDFLWQGTPANGVLDAWIIGDSGIDNLGMNRRDFTYPNAFRGRSFWRHRQDFAGGWQARGAAGWISDMNFLEEYYEAEWEEGYEQRTWLDLRRPVDNRELRFLTSVRVNPFFTQTEWWPRLDHYSMGQPLLRVVAAEEHHQAAQEVHVGRLLAAGHLGSHVQLRLLGIERRQRRASRRSAAFAAAAAHLLLDVLEHAWVDLTRVGL
jgi:hypothetical protein